MVNRGAVTLTPGTTQQTIQQGYHNGSGTVDGDADLVTGNIKSGANIFGVAGKTEVVDTTTGDAVAADILATKKAWVDGAEVTGAMPTRTLSPANDTVQAGYYEATTLSTVDADLATGNVKAGATIFGVVGKTEVVDTTTGDAQSADLKRGQKAWVDGVELTGTAPPAGVPKTGQTTVYRTGDNGTHQEGVAWPNPRFTDNGDGTVTDNLTGLMWTKNANIWGAVAWDTAVDNCEGYSLAGHSDWRLPNVQELQSLIDYGRVDPALCNTAGTGQWTSGNPFTGVGLQYYWSSSTYADSTGGAWYVFLRYGSVGGNVKTSWYYVWPVRGTATVGTLPPLAVLSAATADVAAGYYATTNLTLVDPDLAAGNIRAGATVFGVAGKMEVVDTISGDATAGELLSGKKGWVDGAEVTGSMVNRGAVTFTPGTAAQTVPQGYHNGAGTVDGDVDLVTGNIKAGATIFGVAGKTEVVDTTSGDALAADLKSGKKAWVDGSEITGTASIPANPAPVAKTGQTTSYASKDDGNLKRGVAWPNPRFTDNGNGTVTDNLTGLIWLKNANAFGTRTWANALTDCATLNSGEGGLTDGSVDGDWRLPNVQELQSLIDHGRYNPALCNAAGTGQWTSGDPFTGVVQSDYYWSSSTRAAFTVYAWYVYLYDGYVYYYDKGGTYYVWPVRGGQ
jgi:hypothetical protein